MAGMLRMLASCLLASATMGCTGDRPPTPRGDRPAESRDDGAPANAEAEAGGGEAGSKATGRSIDLSKLHGKPVPPVHPGDDLIIELAESSSGVHPKYRYGWGRAKVDGHSVRFVARTTKPPPPELDGGRSREHFTFRAAAPGRATITIPVATPGEEADEDDFVITVEVTPNTP